MLGPHVLDLALASLLRDRKRPVGIGETVTAGFESQRNLKSDMLVAAYVQPLNVDPSSLSPTDMHRGYRALFLGFHRRGVPLLL